MFCKTDLLLIGVVNQPKNFGASLPGVYRQCAVAYTDFWESYKTVIPSKRHRAVGKETGQTNPIERLNNTFRQRISRLVRESLSFSKKIENHVGEPFGILSMTTMHSKGLSRHHYYRITTLFSSECSPFRLIIP